MDMEERMNNIDKIAMFIIKQIGDAHLNEEKANALLHQIKGALYVLRIYSAEV